MIVLDIETKPTSDPLAIQRIKDSVKAPAQYKKPESIEKWMTEHGEQRAQELVDRTALDASSGSILCIGYAIDGASPAVIGGKEVAILKEFFTLLDDLADPLRVGAVIPPTIVGHNVKGFDIPFIWHRAIIQQVHPPLFFSLYMKRYTDAVYDTMAEWDWQHKVSLSNLAYALFGEEKSGTGADVKDMELSEVYEYCKQDVILTRKIYYMMNFIGD